MNNLRKGKTLTPSQSDEDVSNVRTALRQYYKCKFNDRMMVKKVSMHIYILLRSNENELERVTA